MDTTNVIEEGTKAVGILGAVTAAVVTVFSRKHKAAHEVNNEVVAEYSQLVDLLREQKAELKADNVQLDSRIGTLEQKVDKLTMFYCPIADICPNNPHRIAESVGVTE